MQEMPPKIGDTPRSKVIHARLEPKEFEVLMAAIEKTKVRASDYVRVAVLEQLGITDPDTKTPAV